MLNFYELNQQAKSGTTEGTTDLGGGTWFYFDLFSKNKVEDFCFDEVNSFSGFSFKKENG